MTVHRLLQKLTGDRVIWMVAIVLSIVSLLAVYSSISTLAYKADGNSLKFISKHFVMLVMGLTLMYYVHKIPFKYFARLSQLMIWAAAILLFFTLAFGVNINDASRWIKIPFINITFQTSDFAKIALIVYLAKMINAKRTVLHDFKQGVLPLLLPIGIICGLIFPADLSTAAILGFVCFLMLFIGGVPFRHLGKIILIGIGLVGILYLLGKASPDLFSRFNTWGHRIESFFDPSNEGNYQIDFAQIAIYEGGVLPKGPGTGFTRNFMPHPYSDMIYAFIIEEYGALIGGFGLLLLYLILLFRSIKTAIRCPKYFGSLMVIGLSLMLVIQAVIHMGVAVDILPTTGQPLPLVSMGGTSILFTCLAIGLILSVARGVEGTEDTSESQNQEGTNRIKNTNHAVA